MSDFRELFQTTDYTNFIPNNNQSQAISKTFNIVKGSDLYKGVYDTCQSDIQNILVRYYQVAMFSEHDGEYSKYNYDINENENTTKNIRSFLFKGQSGNGACCYNYKIIEIKNYSINENDVDKFINAIKKKSKNNNSEFKIVFKYYPVYNFENTAPPTGDEISQCYSELLS
jgi:hypothetical protein